MRGLLERAVALRHALHRHPELSGQERATQARLREWLEACLPNRLSAVGGTGLLACFDSGRPGARILLRADIDALPIAEAPDFRPYASRQAGVSHKCGHDGHAAVLAALAGLLARRPLQAGQAWLLFQPAEETGQGAQAVLDDPGFPAQPFDFAFALHNLPGYPLGSMVLRQGPFTPSVAGFEAELAGSTAHAAEPEQGHSPALAVAALLQAFHGWQQPRPERGDFCLITPVQVDMGALAYGTAAGHAVVRHTFRAWRQEALEDLQRRAEALVGELAGQYGLVARCAWREPFQSCRNDAAAVGLLRESARLGGLPLLEPELPFRWGEDFGLFTQRMPGAMFGMGMGEGAPALHTPEYDWDDALLRPCLLAFWGLLQALGMAERLDWT